MVCNSTEKADIRSFNIEELEQLAISLGEKSFRGRQIFSWVHKKFAADFNDMSDLTKALRETLSERCVFTPFMMETKITDNMEVKYKNNSDAIKYLFTIRNNNIIESVLMNHSYGKAVCVSSQAGCRMGCAFCASAMGGLADNLTAGEMCAQVYAIQKDNGAGERVSNVVIMGSGEPLDNYDNVLRFILLISSSEGLGIGQRHITLSTCGLVPQIYRLADEKLQITLAVSLHAPDDEIRQQIMPVAKKYAIDDLLTACAAYSQKTGRRITFEYALISGLNDSPGCAVRLAARLRKTNAASLCHVNIIPVNEIKEKNWKKPNEDKMRAFAAALEARGIRTTVRRRLGSGINAACGQLRNAKKNN